MTTTSAPSFLDIVADLKPLIEEHADAADKQRHMSDEVIDAFKEAGLFQLWMPKSIGGTETSLPDGMRVFEALARIDGSAGWIIWIASSGGPLSSISSEESFNEQYSADKITIGAGGIFPLQPAEKVEGGYKVTAQWPYASGSHHADWLGGGITVVENGETVMSPFGMPEMRFVNFPRADCTILDTWKVTGLRATSSADVVVKDLFVPEHRSVAFGPGMAKNSASTAPIFNVPLLSYLGMPIASIALGIAQHAVDAFLELAASKAPVNDELTLAQQQTTHAALGADVAALKAARAWYYDVAEEIWDLTVAGEAVSLELRLDSSMAGAHATKTAAGVVDSIQRQAGGVAIYETSPIERCFRDIHAVTQHAGTSHRNLTAAGASLLGQAPPNPMIFL